MTVRVAVVDRVPMYARGLVATLSDLGHPADTPADPVQWCRRHGGALVFIGLLEAADWALLATLTAARADSIMVGVMQDLGVDDVVRAVSCGVAGVMPRNAGDALVRDVLHAALGGRALVPVAALRALAERPAAQRPGQRITNDEIRWLRELAAGTTVARLAEQVGYSERMMFRLLAAVYRRLGVAGRTPALILARDRGWL